jgi:hypothetical protein
MSTDKRGTNEQADGSLRKTRGRASSSGVAFGVEGSTCAAALLTLMMSAGNVCVEVEV